jgi:hypothetical protein
MRENNRLPIANVNIDEPTVAIAPPKMPIGK